MVSEAIKYICPIHGAQLQRVLAGGAGWCGSCFQFVQAEGVPMPELDPHIAAKRAAVAVKSKRGRKAPKRTGRRASRKLKAVVAG